jgi:hypothetical protein
VFDIAPTPLNEASLLQGLAWLPKLQYFLHIPAQPFSRQTLAAISRLCPLLEVFCTVPQDVTSDEELLYFAGLFPRLTNLNHIWEMRYLLQVPTSQETHLQLIRLCPGLNTWVISHGVPIAHVDAVLAAHSALTRITVDLTLTCDSLRAIARHCPQLQQLTVRVNELAPRPARELDAELRWVACNCPNIHTLVFESSYTMSVNGLLMIAGLCPALREVVLRRPSAEFCAEKLSRLARLAPGLKIVMP